MYTSYLFRCKLVAFVTAVYCISLISATVFKWVSKAMDRTYKVLKHSTVPKYCTVTYTLKMYYNILQSTIYYVVGLTTALNVLTHLYVTTA